MGKILLSFILAISLIPTNAEVAGSIEETKNTNYSQLLLDNTFELLKLKNSTSQNVSSEPESKVDTDEYQSFNVTAYTAGYESTQKKKGHPLYGITASGERAKEGVTAACPKSLPFGTKIYIEELNHTYVCQDRGGAIKEGHLDIYYDNLKDAKEFGRNQMRVKIIKVS